MAILSVSVCSEAGLVLVSRQFAEMSRLRIEGLVAAFPRLRKHSKEHTFLETERVRYVYQPLEDGLYLLLITNKLSNIVVDLDTLRLLTKVIRAISGVPNKTNIKEHAFDLLLAFDEVISSSGYKEDGATLSAITKNLRMFSNAEEDQVKITKEKEDAARKEMEARAAQIRAEERKKAMNQIFSSHGENKGQSSAGIGGQCGVVTDHNTQTAAGRSPDHFRELKSSHCSDESPGTVVQGMQLESKSRRDRNSIAAVIAEEESFGHVTLIDGLHPANIKTEPNFSELVGKTSLALGHEPSVPVNIVLEERTVVFLRPEGDVESAEVRGSLSIRANAASGSSATVTVNSSEVGGCGGWSLAPHPKIDRGAFMEKGALTVKDGKGFPIGRSFRALKWSCRSVKAVPLIVTCWPEDDEDGSGMDTVSIDMAFELLRPDMTLVDVEIVIPLRTTVGGAQQPSIISSAAADVGRYTHDPARGIVCWHIDVVDSGMPAGRLELALVSGGSGADANTDAFLPVQVAFRSETLVCPIEVVGVASCLDDGARGVAHSVEKELVPGTYQCG